MAENQNPAQPVADPASGAVLQPGRAADPQPARPQVAGPRVARASATPSADRAATVPAASTVPASADPPAPASQANEAPAPAAPGPEAQPDEETAQAATARRQKKWRQLLRQCDRVLLLDFDLLAMDDWPDNRVLAMARRRRDFWFFSVVLAATVFFSGLAGLVPAWVAGTGFGSLAIALLLGVPRVRRLYTPEPSYLDLVFRRRRMMHDARRHVRHLEGKAGLIWQCASMAEFNPALGNGRFRGLLRMSRQRTLAGNLVRREHVRLYLMYLLEAEKAYARMQKAFFALNQQAIDRGWQEVAAEPEVRT